MAPQTHAHGVRQLELRSDVKELDRLADFVHTICESQGLGADQRFALELCLEEAVTNIIMHGGVSDKEQPHIWLALVAGAPSLTISLEDDARPFDPTRVPPPEVATSLEEVQMGGAGLPLMRKLTTAMRYERHEGRNRLILCFGPGQVAPSAKP